jgi:hypothetical protein
MNIQTVRGLPSVYQACELCVQIVSPQEIAPLGPWLSTWKITHPPGSIRCAEKSTFTLTRISPFVFFVRFCKNPCTSGPIRG